MYLEKLFGITIPITPQKLTDQQLRKVTTSVLNAGVRAIENLNFTAAQLQISPYKQKALIVAWQAMFAAACSLSQRPTWDQLPNPTDAYEEALKRQK
jgi:hypothetical protein